MWFKSECDKISDRLWDYTAQRLSVSETTQIDNHLQQCAKCRAEADGYRQTLGLLSAARSMPVPASQTTWRDLRPSLNPERRSVTRSVDWLPRLTLAGAGTVMAATLLVVFLSNGRHPVVGGTPSGAPVPSPGIARNAPAPVDVAQNGNNQDNADQSIGSPMTFDPARPAIVSLPNLGGSGKPDHAALPVASAARLARTRRHYTTHASHWASNVGHSHQPVLASATPTRTEGESGTQQAQQNYVLKTVSPSSDDETTPARRYVISSIPSSQSNSGAVASNEGGDEGRAW